MVRRFNANGEYVSKEQFCKICHLKKSKARQLLQSGLVPCIDTGIPTARYQIALKDVIKYLQDREIDPERFGYRRNIAKSKIHNTFGTYDSAVGAKMRQLAEEYLADGPDLLTVRDIIEFLGYSMYSIYNWKNKLGLKYIRLNGKLFFPKACFLDFIAGPDFYKILYKTEQHIDLLRRAGAHEGK